MSWLWGNETTEQAQIVVSALQSELDEREHKIVALEAALRREQQEFTQLVDDELKELEARKAVIEAELSEVDALIKEKQVLLKSGASGVIAKKSGKKEKKKEKRKETTETTAAAIETVAAEDAATAVGGDATATTTKQQRKTPKATAAITSTSTPKATSKKLPMDEELTKIAKVEPNVVFIIQRSTNANTVVYAGSLTSDGQQLDIAKPMDVYWIMYEKSGAPREELNMIERNTAYGVSCSPSKSLRGQYEAALASLKDRDCVLLLDEHGNLQARTTINGRQNMVMRRVFVQMTSSWGIPTVDYVEIFGIDPQTHEPVYEKKLNK